MNLKRFFIILLLLLCGNYAGAIEDNAIYLAIDEATDASVQVNEPVKAKLEYNIINETTPLLSKYTNRTFESGFMDSFSPSLVYQGNFNFDFIENEQEHTLFQNSLLDLNLNGKLKAPFEFRLQYNLLGKPHTNYLSTFFRDQYITFNKIPHHKIFVGRYKPTIGVEGCGSFYTLPLVTLPQISRNFSAVRSFGAKVEGDYDLVEYSVGAGSSDRKLRAFFPGAEVYGRVNMKPFGKTNGKWGELKVGNGLNVGRFHKNYIVSSYNISYKYKKLGLLGEYSIADRSNGASGFSNKKAHGLVLTAAYNITEKLQGVLRYDIFDADIKKSGKTTTEYTAGLNWFIKGSSLKFMLNYVFSDKSQGHDSHKILVGTQIIL